jgi:hypothetical protein
MEQEVDLDPIHPARDPFKSVAARIIVMGGVLALALTLSAVISLWGASGDDVRLSPNQVGLFIVCLLLCSICAVSSAVMHLRRQRLAAVVFSIVSVSLFVCVFAFMIADFSVKKCGDMAIDLGCAESGRRVLFVTAFIYIGTMILLCCGVYSGYSLYMQDEKAERLVRRAAREVPDPPPSDPEGQGIPRTSV